ncbi:MAG TPA: hypothetical protein VN207_13365 [Ktedonobacteraceae bacterium]|nr:hypothetical protein [Ktedonobacteraceae bacterium]
MARQISKGTCTFCHSELSKSGMTRHLESCQQRATVETKAESHQKVQQTRVFHIIVQGLYLPMYWMHLEVTAETTLATLDQFLKDIWLECCLHLSQFEIEKVSYSAESRMFANWDRDGRSMDVRLDEVLSPGQTCSYEYDFGSTTELTLKVISEREVQAKEKAIQVLARNTLPLVPCDVCGKPSTSICTQCIYEDGGYLCDACGEEHQCGEEMLLPMVNSPRAGVCGYTGEASEATYLAHL